MAYDDSMGTAIPGATGFYAPTPNLSPEELDAYLKRLHSGSVSTTQAQNPENPSAAMAVARYPLPLEQAGPPAPLPGGWNSDMVRSAMTRAGKNNPAPDTSPGSAMRAKWHDITGGEPAPGEGDSRDIAPMTAPELQPRNEQEAAGAAKAGWTYAENPDLWTKKGGSTTADEYGREMQPILQRREYEKQQAETSAKNEKADEGSKAAKIRATGHALERGLVVSFDDDGNPSYQVASPEAVSTLQATQRPGKGGGGGGGFSLIPKSIGPDGKEIPPSFTLGGATPKGAPTAPQPAPGGGGQPTVARPAQEQPPPASGPATQPPGGFVFDPTDKTGGTIIKADTGTKYKIGPDPKTGKRAWIRAQ